MRNDAFFLCSNLETINVDAANSQYSSINGVLIGLDRDNNPRLCTYPPGKKNNHYVIPDCVTSIESFAFWWSANLTSVEIPKSITHLEHQVWDHCHNLTAVYYNAEEPITENYQVFTSCATDMVLYVPEVAVEKCKITPPWMYFKDIQAFDFAGLDSITADELENRCAIYTLDGVKAGETVEGLPSGIYILRQGTKVKKIAVK